MQLKATIELTNPITSVTVFSNENLDISNRMYEKHLFKSRVTACYLKENHMSLLGYINESVLNGLNPEDIVNEYLTETKLEGNISLCKEISISEFWELAIKYENRQNHEEEDNLDFNSEIFSKFIPQVPRYNYNEHMITSDAINYEEPALYTTAMDNEIARIKGNNNPVFVGHPVHLSLIHI